MRTLVLASQSVHRRALLDAAGISYVAATPPFHEDLTRPLSPTDLAIAFARGKAESLASAHPDALILGADQVVELDGEALGKPGTLERAVAQLLRMQGREHRLLTAVALHDPVAGVTTHALSVHRMKMRPLTRELAERYVAAERPLDCAGSYKVESAGALLFEEMTGDDHTGIIGLPLTVMSRLLRDVGVDLLANRLANGPAHPSAKPTRSP